MTKNIFFKKDYNDDDEISKSKTPMMMTIMRHNIEIGK